ncbi:hypothetical protein H4R35_000795 [Dimargaris xerosporica]|nr:hypothetical protein H4R35_000795 [Dimargaris xerosporica]
MRIAPVVAIATSLLMMNTAAFLNQLGFSKTDLSREEYKQLKQYYRQSTYSYLENSELPPSHFVPQSKLSDEQMNQLRLKHGSTRQVGELLRNYTSQRYSPYYAKAMSKIGRLSRDLGIRLMMHYGNHANQPDSLTSSPSSAVSQTDMSPSTPPISQPVVSAEQHNISNHGLGPSTSATSLAQDFQSMPPMRINNQGQMEVWDEEEQRYVSHIDWHNKQAQKNRQKTATIFGYSVPIPSLHQSSAYQRYENWKDNLPIDIYKKQGKWLDKMQRLQHRLSDDLSSDQATARRNSI